MLVAIPHSNVSSVRRGSSIITIVDNNTDESITKECKERNLTQLKIKKSLMSPVTTNIAEQIKSFIKDHEANTAIFVACKDGVTYSLPVCRAIADNSELELEENHSLSVEDLSSVPSSGNLQQRLTRLMRL